MQIHVVQSGDTLSAIANSYNITVETIVSVNELDTPNELVVGQALVIPIVGQFYFVQQGDSLYSIAQKFGISYQELARINNVSVNSSLSTGFRLYIPPRQEPITEVNAYVEPYGDTVSSTLKNATQKHAPNLTYLSPFSYRVTREGNIIPPPLDNFSAIASNNNVGLVLVLTNLEEGEFSADLGRIIVTNETVQDTLFENIIQTARNIGYRDVHFDFEFLPPDTRENYNNFLRKAKRVLSEAGLLISTALAPKTSGTQQGKWYEAHDYPAHGDIVDFVVLMTYEWGYSGGPPMAVSPIKPVREVVEYARSVIPSNKLFLGQNLYGYDWTLPFEQGGEFAKALSPKQAVALARARNVAIEYDTDSQAPFFNYYDDAGKEHIVWFEDARSIQAKFDLIKELNLRGISYWKLGLAFPQNWVLLEANFKINKIR
ncbi:glycoside hydrolase family 18 protein [Aquibacillus sp. 3ASR75-11]|uniref:Glycoside hydrolase family 18 protein n=1 Tax=Terrihalobacillus insolitus TaxID=2950438 RepID=A0A9X3WXY7_9BACI|nr:glycoside hydrolase family 18 protein [Terrihalobacillus insolitus]MDC3415245.1 glycoside hydrolase family 18 protein [Terrihalobacillus insolitus]MDC3426316.1 glycoside hydrolase family 18 protein [Terrihalobacillus insolitus]